MKLTNNFDRKKNDARMSRNFTYLKPKTDEEIQSSFANVSTLELHTMLFNNINDEGNRASRKLIKKELLARGETKMLCQAGWGDLRLRKIYFRDK